jgi:TPR repeat protein
MNLFKSLLAGLVLALCLFGTAAADPFDDGLAAFKREDYAAALALWRPLAEQGDPSAQGNLGFLYEEGHGVPKDYVQAAAWYRKAADQGLAYAQGNLGFLYEKGHGVPQDYVQAVAWYRKAADQGDAYAQSNLGIMYENGRGVPQDYVQAVAWYRKAADQGDADAQENLGIMYGNGRGVPQDYVEAYKWLSISAARMPPGTDGDRVVASRDWYAANLDATGLAQAQREASSWTPTATATSLADASTSEGETFVSPGLFVIVVLLVGVFIWMLAGLRMQKGAKPLTADSYQKAFTPEAEAAPESLTEAAAPVQKATPEAAPPSAISPPLPAEPPSADTDLTPRPWVRFFAKWFDMSLMAAPVIAFAPAMFTSGGLEAWLLQIVMGGLAWLLIEPLVLASFQTTPGRALLSTKLIYEKGQQIPLGVAYERTLRVYIKGMWLGLPIVYLFPYFLAYRHLTKQGTTSWDQDGGFEVRHGKISRLRIMLMVLIYTSLIVFGALTSAWLAGGAL